MFDDQFQPARPAASSLDSVRVIADAVRVRQQFEGLRPTIHHTLHVTPVAECRFGRLDHGEVRTVPCPWGARRDEYRWDLAGGGDRRDAAVFRTAAAMAGALTHHSPQAWRGLLPGTMQEVMGVTSDLYLADYWALVLHHLVWIGALPYPIRATWVEGGPLVEGPFQFTSELPTDVTEASKEALILLEEAAFASLGEGSITVRGPAIPRAGLPWYHRGQWALAVPGQTRSTVGETNSTARANPGPELATEPRDAALAAAGEPASEPATSDDEPGPIEDETPPTVAVDLTLDDQSFIVRYGTASYRFPPRSKQLFALLERVARRPGHRVDFDDLRTIGDVWDGSPVEDSTIRGSVARLRAVLAARGMDVLAARIKTGTYRGSAYVLLDAPGALDSDE